MSYCYDVMRRAWNEMEHRLPDSEVVVRFGILMEAMHSANHRLNDGVNHDLEVTRAAEKLEHALEENPLPE